MKRVLIFPICWIIALATFAYASAQQNNTLAYLDTNEIFDFLNDPSEGELKDSNKYHLYSSHVQSIVYDSFYDWVRLNGNRTANCQTDGFENRYICDSTVTNTGNIGGTIIINDGVVDVLRIRPTDGDIERNLSSSNFNLITRGVTRIRCDDAATEVTISNEQYLQCEDAINSDVHNLPVNTSWYRLTPGGNHEIWDFTNLISIYDGNIAGQSEIDTAISCDKATPKVGWYDEAARATVHYHNGDTRYIYFRDNQIAADESAGCHRDSLETLPRIESSPPSPPANIQPVQQGTQSRGNDNHGTSTDSSNRQEDVEKSTPTQTTPPVNDSDKIAALQQNIVDLQADVVSLNALVDKLLKENAALRHDNAVLSTLIDANQRNIIVVDEVVSEEATEVSQGTTETVSIPQVETSVTATVDISGYEFVDIAPDGRPRIISTVDVQIHPDTRKRFLSEWGRFYDEHRDIEWWDCAGWSPYENPPTAVPVSEINANPHNHCDLRKP